MGDAGADMAGACAQHGCGRATRGIRGGRAKSARGGAAGCARRRAVRQGEREGAGLPKQEQLFQAVEDARQDGSDHGMQRAGAGLLHLRGCAQAGELVDQSGWVKWHLGIIAGVNREIKEIFLVIGFFYDRQAESQVFFL